MKATAYDANLRCSFCGKSPSEIDIVMEGGSSEASVRICNDCFTNGLSSIARSGADLAQWVSTATQAALPEAAPTAKTYRAVDPIINGWIEENSLTLYREWVGDARFWYTWRGSECFQVSVDLPNEEHVTVHAWAVDTDDDAELHGEWTVPKAALKSALAVATKLIDLWATRDRMTA